MNRLFIFNIDRVISFLRLGSKHFLPDFNQAGENSSFIFTVFLKSVPRYHFKLYYVVDRYHFKLAYVILQMAVKEFFETDF